ncbi:uncharacterized protein RSE6_00958 [Rhynchosporium secalis]|uniref:VOC domain-containing protein n=1 Tax=Rhynchosporium secalis TaxID=38038 RepID=A0A1E1LWJ4_RHYSE|nr:uncharacterized protein RSE6_00958 [Rhynchosporium secalis]
MPIAHVSLPSSSLLEATAFYLAALKPLGYELFLALENQVGLKLKYGGPDFCLHTAPTDQKGNVIKSAGLHVAFTGGSQKAVREWWEAALCSVIERLEVKITAHREKDHNTPKATTALTFLISRETTSNARITSRYG